MPFGRPTLTELRDEAKADFGVAARLRYSNERIIAEVLAGHAHGHYGYLDWIARQAVPFTATGEFADAWGALKGVTRKPAAVAAGEVTFTGTVGAEIPEGSGMVRADGVAYVATAAASVGGGGSVTVPVQSSVASASANGDDGVALTLSVAIAGINSTGAANGPLTGGADVESDDEFKARYLEAYAAPPKGGAAPDYPAWAKEVPGVTRAWANPRGMGAGTVVVYVMLGEAFPAGNDGVAAADDRDAPATGDQLAVADALYLVQPTGALVYVAAPQANTVAFTLDGGAGWSGALRAQVEAAIDDVFLRDGDPLGGTVNLSDLNAEIAAVAGTAGFVVTAVSASHGTIDPVAGNITSAVGRLPVRGVVTYAA